MPANRLKTRDDPRVYQVPERAGRHGRHWPSPRFCPQPQRSGAFRRGPALPPAMTTGRLGLTSAGYPVACRDHGDSRTLCSLGNDDRRELLAGARFARTPMEGSSVAAPFDRFT